MIKVLGKKRVLGLFILIGINIVLIGGVYMYLTPQKIKKERELRGMRGQIATMQGDIERLQIEFEQLEYQQAEFEDLKADGFFGTQNRRDAKLALEALQKEAGVVSAVANIKPGTFVDDEEAAKAEHKVLSSPISVRVEAVDDIDIYKYLSLLETSFPGHVSLEKLTLSRKAEITATILRAISSGRNPPLVQAEIDLVWRTMVPVADVLPEEGAL